MIEIKISGATPLEALASATAFGLRCQLNGDVYAAAQQIMEAEAHKQAKREAKAAAMSEPTTPEVSNLDTNEIGPGKPSSEVAVEEPNVEPTPFPEPQTEGKPKPREDVPTPEETRAAGINASRKYGQNAVVEILHSLGVKKISDLPEGQRSAFIEAVRKLGETNA